MTTTLHNSSSAVSTLSNVRTVTIHERSKGQRIGNVQESTLQRDIARLRTKGKISTGNLLMTSQTDMIGFHWRSLNLKGMKSLWGRKVSDLGFSDFVQKLKHIASKKSTEIRFIDKWYPSSKTCHVCGAINPELNLRDRTWQCPNCHTELDRDRNAALNIHRVGASTLSGEAVSPGSPGNPR